MSRTEGSMHVAWWKVLAGIVVAMLIAKIPILLVNNRFPEFSPERDVEAADSDGVALGVAYVDGLLHIYEEGMQPWLPNDRFYPTIALDNTPQHQLGQLEGLRTAVFVLRENLSRLGVEDRVDPDVEEAFNRFAIDPDAWWFPSAEQEYAAGAEALRRYRARLIDGQARFYARPDNFLELLARFHSLIGAANMGLYSTIGDLQQWIEQKELEGRLTAADSVAEVRVGRFEADDRFYFAKGIAFAYREVLNASAHDFAGVLRVSGARKLAAAIVHDYLAFSQFDPPIILNGGFGSLAANHPYQLLGLLSQVRERSYSLAKLVDPRAS